MKKYLALAVAILFALAGSTYAAKAGKEHQGLHAIVKSIDADKHTITVETRGKDKQSKEETFTVSKDVKLADVSVGAHVALSVGKDNVVEKIETMAKRKKEK